jgi:hypothetical protein
MATIEQRKSINTFVAKQHFALNVALRHMPNHAPSQRDSTVKEKKKKKKKKKFKNSSRGGSTTTANATSERDLVRTTRGHKIKLRDEIAPRSSGRERLAARRRADQHVQRIRNQLNHAQGHAYE